MESTCACNKANRRSTRAMLTMCHACFCLFSSLRCNPPKNISAFSGARRESTLSFGRFAPLNCHELDFKDQLKNQYRGKCHNEVLNLVEFRRGKKKHVIHFARRLECGMMWKNGSALSRWAVFFKGLPSTPINHDFHSAYFLESPSLLLFE